MNLHQQCHELIHFDIPWSLIRIEQRNGRIDRYGQTDPPQITTLLLEPAHERVLAGDLPVLTRLLAEGGRGAPALGDAASLMGQYDVEAEEEAVARALEERRDLDDVVPDPRGDSSAGVLVPTTGTASTAAVVRGDVRSAREQDDEDDPELASVDPSGLSGRTRTT